MSKKVEIKYKRIAHGVDENSVNWFERDILKTLAEHEIYPYLFIGYEGYESEDENSEHVPMFANGANFIEGVMLVGHMLALYQKLFGKEDSKMSDLLKLVALAAMGQEAILKGEADEGVLRGLSDEMARLCDKYNVDDPEYEEGKDE